MAFQARKVFGASLQIILDMNPRSNRKPMLGQRSTLKKHKGSMTSKPEPAMWLRGTGQRIPCFDWCQLTPAWMFNIKDTRCKPRVQDLVQPG